MEMLAGRELGEALTRAMAIKGIGPSALARHFNVTPSSVGDWRRRGCIHKRHLGPLVAYFADVVPPSHWGLQARPGAPGTGTAVVGTRLLAGDLYAVEGDRQRLDEKRAALARELASVDVSRLSPMAIELARGFDAIQDERRQLESFVKCSAIIGHARS